VKSSPARTRLICLVTFFWFEFGLFFPGPCQVLLYDEVLVIGKESFSLTESSSVRIVVENGFARVS
jgi:hypothetical protein